MKGTIFNIQKFCVNDGPGIRTTVFLKGCSLNCIWCHNPESQSSDSEIMFYTDKCSVCGRCSAVCPNRCHSFDGDVHSFERSRCIRCFACTETGCDALERVGREITSDEVVDEVLKDKIFYDNSGGGITLSGGEPLYQLEFSLELLRKAKENSLHTAVETCGFTSPNNLKQIAEYTDLFLFDYKETNPVMHKAFTGVGNEIIISNLKLLDSLRKQIILRCPIIPGHNDRQEHFKGICRIANDLENITCVEIEPYHSLGENKYSSLGRNAHKINLPDEEQKADWLNAVSRNCCKNVKFA